MSKLIFNSLYIFSSSEKLAKKINFSKKRNIITSSSKDGTKRGKSIIMKSLYHTLGADCYFDDKWNDSGKTYILDFSVDDKEYYMFRTNDLFKLFDSHKNIIFKTIHRHELAVELKKLLNFAVELPNRKEDKLEVTPPVYNYLPYFIDQDYLQGPNFASFKHLEQYQNYKENALLYHFGVFNSDYFNLVKELEQVKSQIAELNKNKQLYEEILERIFSDVKSVSYVKSVDHLRKEVSIFQEKYSVISCSLTKIKNELIKLRNDKFEINSSIAELSGFNKKTDKEIVILGNSRCPYCYSKISDYNKFLIKKYGLIDDSILMINSLEATLVSIETRIASKEKEYEKWLTELNNYKHLLEEKNEQINDIIKHQGYMEVRDSVLEEYSLIKESLSQLNTEVKNLDKRIKEYSKKKTQVNNRYYELMLEDKTRFGLEEIDSNKLKKFTSVYKAGGSNRPITTVMWYINLIKIKNEFNNSAICFPIVFDSPNNAETDTEKKLEVYQYLVDNSSDNNQLVVSGIGYGEEGFNDLDFDNVIYLQNQKYKLLCHNDYQQFFSLLQELTIK